VCGRFAMEWNATGRYGPRHAQDLARGLLGEPMTRSVSLHMRAVVVERRQAVVVRLLVLRASGRLHGDAIRAAAESLGVTERSVWRWLAEGGYAPGKRPGWRMTPKAVEAFYRCGGRPTAAWRLLQDEGMEAPSRTVFCDAVKRDLSPAERAYARHGEDGRRRYSVYRRWEPRARNEVWEADHDKLEINVLPLRGKRLVRPWLTVIEDGFSRLVMGWALSLFPTTAEVLVAIREAIVIDQERGPWGGVPELIRFDGGREFLAHAVSRQDRSGLASRAGSRVGDSARAGQTDRAARTNQGLLDGRATLARRARRHRSDRAVRAAPRSRRDRRVRTGDLPAAPDRARARLQRPCAAATASDYDPRCVSRPAAPLAAAGAVSGTTLATGPEVAPVAAALRLLPAAVRG
jgi:hypothetical protein